MCEANINDQLIKTIDEKISFHERKIESLKDVRRDFTEDNLTSTINNYSNLNQKENVAAGTEPIGQPISTKMSTEEYIKNKRLEHGPDFAALSCKYRELTAPEAIMDTIKSCEGGDKKWKAKEVNKLLFLNGLCRMSISSDMKRLAKNGKLEMIKSEDTKSVWFKLISTATRITKEVDDILKS